MSLAELISMLGRLSTCHLSLLAHQRCNLHALLSVHL